jgi:peptide/nickel transport system substrate-binding protein
MSGSSFSKRSSVCRAVLIGCALAAACSPRTRRTPDDTIVIVIPNLIRDLDPRFAITNYDAKLSRLVAPGLTTADTGTMEPVNELASSIERVGSDYTWDVILKPDLKFSDGSPVTAADVAFSYWTTMDARLGAIHRQSFRERFLWVEPVDRRRVRFHLVQPIATFFSDLDFGIISARAAGDDLRFDGGTVIGAGPYRVVEVGPERALLERNPYYWGQPPPVDRIEVKVVRDQNARALMLVGGSADIVQNSVRLDLVDDIAARGRIHVTSGPSAVLTYLMMNNEHPILSDVRVRRAIAYAIDREAIIDAKFHGRARLSSGLLPPIHWAYEPDVPRYLHDPARAAALLDEAGYPDPDGPGGEPRFRMTYKTSADAFRVAVARILADQLGAVGIDVEVRSFEFGTFFMDIKKGNYELASMQTSAISEPDMAYTYFHSSRVPTPDDLHLHNRWRYRNPELDDLLERGRSAMNRERRVALYGEAQKILARDLPVIPLWHEDNVAVMNVDLTGYQVFPNARFRGLAVADKR